MWAAAGGRVVGSSLVVAVPLEPFTVGLSVCLGARLGAWARGC